MFLLFRKACLLYKTSKIVFSRSIFTIYDMGIQRVTGGYKGLHGVTRGYKGLQGVSKGLQGETGGDKGLEGVAKDYRNIFFKLDRSQIVFLGLFCIKIKVEEMSNF